MTDDEGRDSFMECDEPTLDQLDEDSLLEVFGYFSFDELLLMSRVCTRFLQLSRRCLRKIRHFELDYRAIASKQQSEEQQQSRLRDIFTNVGSNLESFKFSGGFIMNEDLKRGIVTGVALNCSGTLQHLTINYVELREEHLVALTALLSHLTGLDLGRCALRDETFGPFIARASNLRTLAIPGNAELHGEFLERWQDCQRMEQLDVSYCYSLNVGNLKSFLAKAVNLKAVDVTACQWLEKDKGIFHACERKIESRAELPVFSYFKHG
uniref:F-box domain-containing protein n=1 Tax=Culex tarsalis TaxID=7177 RepID=A0A1Q3FI00_CULTA